MSGRSAGAPHAAQTVPGGMSPVQRVRVAASRAQRRLQFAVHVEQPRRPGALVQVVDILRDDQQLARPFGIEPRQRAMRGIGLDPASAARRAS